VDRDEPVWPAAIERHARLQREALEDRVDVSATGAESDRADAIRLNEGCFWRCSIAERMSCKRYVANMISFGAIRKRRNWNRPG
jgi:hypothetical protein